MAGLYADENFPLPVVEELRRLGFDVLTMYEDDKANQSLTDDVVLTIANGKERALLTLNLKHFFQLHQQRPNHQGIIVCTFVAKLCPRRAASTAARLFSSVART